MSSIVTDDSFSALCASTDDNDDDAFVVYALTAQIHEQCVCSCQSLNSTFRYRCFFPSTLPYRWYFCWFDIEYMYVFFRSASVGGAHCVHFILHTNSRTRLLFGMYRKLDTKFVCVFVYEIHFRSINITCTAICGRMPQKMILPCALWCTVGPMSAQYLKTFRKAHSHSQSRKSFTLKWMSHTYSNSEFTFFLLSLSVLCYNIMLCGECWKKHQFERGKIAEWIEFAICAWDSIELVCLLGMNSRRYQLIHLYTKCTYKIRNEKLIFHLFRCYRRCLRAVRVVNGIHNRLYNVSRTQKADVVLTVFPWFRNTGIPKIWISKRKASDREREKKGRRVFYIRSIYING